jgi:EpsD family peptidyl-prolyl cis-trans isomerase
MSNLSSVITASVASAILCLGLTACGNKEEKKAASQLAAKVGAAEISVHQINQVLSRNNALAASPEAAKAMSREILEKLIDQQLAIEQAVENKLDRTPEVLSQIEASRREIIAKAYLQKIASAQPKPSTEEVKKYYSDYPQLFAERRIYNLQETVVPSTSGVVDQFRGFVASGKSIEESVAWLKNKDVKFRTRAVRLEAEKIPLETLARLHKMKDGQSMLAESAQGVAMLRIAGSQAAPVSEAIALPRIEQYLTNRSTTEALTAKFKELRAATKIDYVGEFAMGDDATKAGAASATQATADAGPTEEEKAKAMLEKGLEGIK